MMKNFRLIEERVDVAPLMQEVDHDPELWNASTARQDKIAVQRETMRISLRGPVKAEGIERRDIHGTRDTKLHPQFPTINAWVEGFVARHGGTLGRVGIVALNPKGRVYRHYDRGAYYFIRDRYHLVLQSRAGSEMNCGDEDVTMREGELWWLNNNEEHESFNGSDQPRIHIIFDVLPAGIAMPADRPATAQAAA